MRTVSDIEIIERIRQANPWWNPPHEIDPAKRRMRHRGYFAIFQPLVVQRDPKRAVILMGPRRVGKTVMLNQAIQSLIDSGTPPGMICLLDLQTPLFSGIGLERLLHLGQKAAGADPASPFFIFFDEVQYLRDWEVHLKNCVDTYDSVKFVVSGSAAAALRQRSQESGAGRFTDFLLPPVTFCEYLALVDVPDGKLIRVIPAWDDLDGERHFLQWNEEDIGEINRHFLNYLNVGSYPEAILSKAIQSDPGRFLRSDIIEKVLASDLPSLYGISDPRELTALFTMLAYNTAQEVSLEKLAANSNVEKPTIKRYIEYLEAAFLVRVLHRVDRTAKRFKRANFFKVYLTNPCMRSALFAPVGPDSEYTGSMVETAIFSQWLHTETTIHYARWDGGEVDFVFVDLASFRPHACVEAKWSDAVMHNRDKIKSVTAFLRTNADCEPIVTTRTKHGTISHNGRNIMFFPAAVYCYYVGWITLAQKRVSARLYVEPTGADMAE